MGVKSPWIEKRRRTRAVAGRNAEYLASAYILGGLVTISGTFFFLLRENGREVWP
jgi:hypothetical protein